MTLVRANEISRRPARARPRPPRAAAPDNGVRVLHIAQSVAGGVATFFEEIAPYQSEIFGEANVNFLIPEGGEIHLPRINPSQIITFHATTRRPTDLLKFGRAARQAIHRLRPNLLHLHSSFAGAVVRVALSPATSRPQIIYCPHGWSFGMETGRAAKFAYAAVERLLARRTDRILVNSTSEYELAVQFGLPRHKILRVANGIGWAPPAPKRARPTGPLRVAFVGRHDRQKGLDILLDAISRFGLRNIQFHIVGEPVLGRDEDRHFHAGNVTFHGWLPRSEMSALLQEMDAVVMPSRWEAFGLVAIEAMRAGVPVIGSNRGALPEVIRDGVGGYTFDIDDGDGLGRLLKRLDAEELRRLGVSARHLWEREYVADRMNRLTSEAYREVLAGASSMFWPPADSHRLFPRTLSGGKTADAS